MCVRAHMYIVCMYNDKRFKPYTKTLCVWNKIIHLYIHSYNGFLGCAKTKTTKMKTTEILCVKENVRGIFYDLRYIRIQIYLSRFFDQRNAKFTQVKPWILNGSQSRFSFHDDAAHNLVPFLILFNLIVTLVRINRKYM